MVSFNAGKMTVKPTANGKFLVTPQLDKGKVCLPRGDDQLLHFQWVDRQTRRISLFSQMMRTLLSGHWPPQRSCLHSAVQKFVAPFLFLDAGKKQTWNKDASRDEELVKKVSDSMNNAQAVSRSDGGRGAGNNVQLDHNAILQMLGDMGAGDQSSEVAQLL
ncbi:hypothetical protein PsorP6_010281 [Peronosclerospora sorghi]|uniref:Uncharacterized protein n=1 Tax=Peronosclerospora sorghi TaxID=230839 RepID=A0ACC0VVI8_9STRA|nr:hypothetical protein PsorP6_010281 [Peronosclerospora sorghi]